MGVPRDQAAGEVDDVVAELPQRRDDRARTAAATADRDDPALLRQLLQPLPELAERDVERLRDVAEPPLPGLADVERDGAAGVEQRARLARVDLLHRYASHVFATARSIFSRISTAIGSSSARPTIPSIATGSTAETCVRPSCS